jgi:hypothetical protein
MEAATAGTDYSAGTSLLSTGILKSTTTTGALTIAVAGDFPTLNQNTTGSAASLTTARSIYGNNFDGTANVTGVIGSTYGGTGNGFAKFTGPSASEKTFTLPDASATILTTNTAVTVGQGGTGATTLASNAVLVGNGTSALQSVSPSTSGNVLTSNGTSWVSQAPAAGASDATTTATGKVQLAGDLGGTNTSATAPVISNLAISTGKLADLAVTNAKINDVAASKISGTLLVANGGTGASSTTKNYVFAGPTSNNGAPGFRALEGSDLPTATFVGDVTGSIYNNTPNSYFLSLGENTVTSAKIVDGTITYADIADETIGFRKLATDAVTGPKIFDGAVSSQKIADAAVTTAKIANGAVTTAKIANGAVTDAKITSVAASKITGTLAIANGGTGSSTQNFVDLSTTQSAIGGAKTFTNTLKVNSGTAGGAVLEVNGASTNTMAYNASSGTSIDFAKSNLAYTTASATAFTLSGMKDGGTYTLAVQGGASGTSSFTAGSGSFTFKPYVNALTTANTHTLYTFIVMGSTIYYSMVTGL